MRKLLSLLLLALFKLSYGQEAQPALSVGDRVPSVRLFTQDEQPFDLLAAAKDHLLVFYFYPKDDTPGCTKEACYFRDQYAVFESFGARVVGVSKDDAASHRAFRQKYGLNYTLLSDTNEEAMKAFGVEKVFGKLPGRVTFVIDKAGIVRHRFNSLTDVKAHIDKALVVVKALATASEAAADDGKQ